MARINFSKKNEIYFWTPDENGNGVRRIAEKVAKDVAQTSGVQTMVGKEYQSCAQAVIALTDGCSEIADQMVYENEWIKQVVGRRESYAFLVAEHPAEGIGQALIIYGSDKLGTIYGLFHLSELLGVTPFVFWGDCPYPSWESVVLTSQEEDTGDTKQREKRILVKEMVSKEPSVKYRGFFINDEWPCYGNWTFSHFDGFNAKMYDHVFEYLLRMKGNYMWPAMWTSSFLEDGPDLESMKLADEYGIYIGMSHHEPCMRSGEEYSHVRGKDSPYGDAWSYVTNKDGILRFWEDGLKRSVGHNVFPTIGMRGERDSKMLGDDAAISENVRLLKEIITNQRRMIEKYLEKDGRKVPQLFAVYKEVEDYYFGEREGAGLEGFEELDDVTLLLCEDNHGNMRALPKESVRGHKGGFGMYYHLDYHGDPVSYEWVASTPLMKIWEQMTEAYEYGVRELWIVNVGDVKFQEFPLGYFMELAYDFEQWGTTAPNQTGAYTQQWLEQVFGAYTSEQERADIRDVLEGYLRLNGLRRPEALNDTIYHPAHYMESEKMLQECEKLEQKNEALLKTLRERGMESGYYSMIYFPAAASLNLLKMHLYSGKNHLYSAQGKALANVMGGQMEDCVLRDEQLAADWAAFADGKWDGMQMASHIGFTNWNDEDWRYPVRHVVRLPEKPRLVVSRADETKHFTNQYFPKPLVVDDFRDSDADCVKLQIANGGQGIVKWHVDTEECDWLEFSVRSGETGLQDELILTVCKEKLPIGEEVELTFYIRTETEFVPVRVRTMNRDRSMIPSGTFVSQNEMYVMDAVDFAKKTEGRYQEQAAGFEALTEFGKFGSGVKVFPVTAAFAGTEHAPSVTYQVWGEEPGNYCLELHTSPANPLVYGKELTMAVAAGDTDPVRVDLIGAGYKGGEGTCASWCEAVLSQEHVAETTIRLEAGLNEITVYAQEAGVVLERIVIYPEQMNRKDSYLGPEGHKPI